jgi:4-amino-4-deoxy-L-arabinose transferase-like glycosyltransferase
MIHRVERIVIGSIVVVYLVIAGQYATRTPDWQAPDEPAHYNYVRQIVDEGRLPVLEMGDWNQSYQNALTTYKFAPAVTKCENPPDDVVECPGLESVEYEDHQPPLYYLFQAPVYALTGGDLTAMRLLSVLLGAGVVLTTWATLWVLFPRWPGMALTGAAFVAFIPQHLAILGSVSNDALAELVVGLTLLATAIYLGAWRVPDPEDDSEHVRQISPVVLGVLAGVALLTKTTIYFLGGIVVLAVLLRWRREKWPRQQAIKHLAAVLIPALVMGGVWWGRNLHVYGGTDFAGLERHDEIAIDQPRTGDYIEQFGTREYLKNYAKTTFHSFWGQFGWMAVPMPTNVYRLSLLFTVGVGVGGGLFVRRREKWPCRLEGPQRDALIVLAAVLVFTVAAYLLYNLDFVQFQGRYLYPALLPLGLLVAAGLNGWTALVENRFPGLQWLPVLAMIGLAVFAWYALDTYLVPNL